MELHNLKYAAALEEAPEREPRGTRIQSVTRACRLLMLVAESLRGVTAKEAALAQGLALPTTYHLLNTLVDEGLLARDTRRRCYVLGRGTAVLAQAYLRGSAVPESLLAALRELADRTGETAYLADWGDHEIRVLASLEGTNILRVAEVAAGPYEDGHARANGKVLLAHASAEMRELYLRTHPLRQRTPATIVERDKLDAELTRVRALGIAYDQEEYAEGVCCAAAPLMQGGRLVASFCVSLPSGRFAQRREELTRTLLDVIARIGAPGASNEDIT